MSEEVNMFLSWDSPWLRGSWVSVSDVANIPSPDGMGEFSIDAELSDKRWGSEPWPVSLMQDACPLPASSSFQVQCADHDSDGWHDLIGTWETTLALVQTAGAGSLVSFLSPCELIPDFRFSSSF